MLKHQIQIQWISGGIKSRERSLATAMSIDYLLLGFLRLGSFSVCEVTVFG